MVSELFRVLLLQLSVVPISLERPRAARVAAISSALQALPSQKLCGTATGARALPGASREAYAPSAGRLLLGCARLAATACVCPGCAEYRGAGQCGPNLEQNIKSRAWAAGSGHDTDRSRLIAVMTDFLAGKAPSACRSALFCALSLMLPLFALAAQDVPVPASCTPEVNQHLAELVAQSPQGTVDNVMVCGTTISPSRTQRGGPHGSHQVLPLLVSLPE